MHGPGHLEPTHALHLQAHKNEPYLAGSGAGAFTRLSPWCLGGNGGVVSRDYF